MTADTFKASPRSTFAAIRKSTIFIEPGRRGRWVLLVGFAVLVSISEAVGAILIFGLLGLVTSESTSLPLPLIGDITRFFPRRDLSEVLKIVAAFTAAFFFLRGLLYLAQSYLQYRIVHNAGVLLSVRLLRGYLRAPYSMHLRRNSAELIRNAYYSVLELVAHAFVPIVNMFSELLIVAGIFIALLVTAPAVTVLIMVVLVPIVLVTLRVVRPRLERLGRVHQELGAETLKVLQQSLSAIREIRLAGRESFFEQNFANRRSLLASTSYMRALLMDVPRVTIETTVVLFILGFLGYSAADAARVDDAVPVLGLFAYGILRILPSINRVLSGVSNIRFGFAVIDDLHEDLVTLERDANLARRTASPFSLDREVCFERVTYAYEPGRQVVHPLNLTIRKGEFLGVVGSTGSGKSTFVDLLMGLIPPTGGSITIDDLAIADVRPGWQNSLSLVPQTIFLLDDTLRRNIAFGLEDHEIDHAAVTEAVEVAQLRPFVEGLEDGLDTVVGERGVRMSGGERQRVAIARSFYTRPEVLVFDEGTSALDNTTEAALMKALEPFRRVKTIVIVAHRLTTVRRCDRILFFDGGHLVDTGTFDELIERNESFKRMTNSEPVS